MSFKVSSAPVLFIFWVIHVMETAVNSYPCKTIDPDQTHQNAASGPEVIIFFMLNSTKRWHFNIYELEK